MWEELEPDNRIGKYRNKREIQRKRMSYERQQYKSHRHKRRRKRRIIKRLAVIALIIPVFMAAFRAKDIVQGEKNLALMALTNGKVRQVLAHKEQYPEELLELLRNNAETADFVLGYPEKKDAPPADTVGEVTAGVIPLLLQWDERWGYCMYGDDMIAINGCGPTAVAMVAAGLTGDNTITPYKVARFSAENGYYAGDSGTSWTLMTEGARQFGICGDELSLSENSVYSALENGHPVICSMRPGDFTTTGHFIVLVGVEEGKIRVNDPNSKERSAKLWDYSRLEPQINNLWEFTLI